MTKLPRVLFICTANACRSQMAEAWLKSLAGERFEVLSAGTEPKGLDPRATRAMAELGIDIAGQTSDRFDPAAGPPVELVIAVCDRAARSCPPLAPGTAFLCWPFPDPAAATGGEAAVREEFRRVRDLIREQVQRWLAAGAPFAEVESELEGARPGARPFSQS